jgi:hypothetical protein
MKLIAVLLLALGCLAEAQDKPKDIVISDAKKVLLLEAQVHQLGSILERIAAEKKEAQMTKELNDAINSVFSEYGFTRDDHVMCGGPSKGECSDAPDYDIVFRVKEPKK